MTDLPQWTQNAPSVSAAATQLLALYNEYRIVSGTLGDRNVVATAFAALSEALQAERVIEEAAR